MIEDYKVETERSYNAFVDVFDTKFEEYLKYVENEIDEFLRRLPSNGSILDVGSGPGNHALRFQNRGYEVLCIDIAEEMIQRCEDSGLEAKLMDFENMQIPENSFDGAWAYTSLLHVPKENFGGVLNQISKVVKPSGIFFLGMKEGDGEGFIIEDKYPGTKRWFSLYTNNELREYFKDLFQVEFHSKTKVKDKIFLNYILRKV